jgi:hypothetical protein
MKLNSFCTTTASITVNNNLEVQKVRLNIAFLKPHTNYKPHSWLLKIFALAIDALGMA